MKKPWLAVVLTILVIGLLAWAAMRLGGMRVSRFDRHPGKVSAISPAGEDCTSVASEKPSNIIILVADGMGFAHLAAGRITQYGVNAAAPWDRFTTNGWHRSHPSAGVIVDSAASATAFATGRLTTNGAVGVDANGRPISTLFELAHERGYTLGMVTDSYVWDATPAAFIAHVRDRDQAANIQQQLAQSPLVVLLGELEDVGEDGVPTRVDTERMFSEAGWVVHGADTASMAAITGVDDSQRVTALYDEEQITNMDSSPNLPQLVQAGLTRIAKSDQPFVLLVESEELDSASHRRDFSRVTNGFEVIGSTIDLLLDFAEQRGDTLVLFTGDHETGGLAVSVADWNDEVVALWSSDSHTAVPVPLFATGPGAPSFAGAQTNWEVGCRLQGLLDERSAEEVDGQPESQ